MVLYYLLCILGSHSHDKPPVVAVDAIERNICYDDRGDVCYTQIVLWEFLPYLSHHGVVAWTMADGLEPPVMRGGVYHLRLEALGTTYRVRATSYVETRTHVSQDPERRDRMIWPEHLRRGWR